MTQKKPAKDYGSYAEFLAVVFQMFFIIVLGTVFGQFLDGKLLHENSTAWFTILFSFSSLALALYLMIQKLDGKK